MAKVRTGNARSPDQRIVDGIREFYLGLLSKHLTFEAFDSARSDSATLVAMGCLQQIRREIAASGVRGTVEASDGSQAK